MAKNAPISARLRAMAGRFALLTKGESGVNFDEEHARFVNAHLAARSGERKGRLVRGHRHAERLFLLQVWWPLKGNFDNLHPEYEVLDWRGRSYFVDFAWLVNGVRLIIEIKGFATHVRDMDREKYSNECNRETFLSGMGYQVISFTYDDVKDRPELCITLLRMVLSRFQPSGVPVSPALLAEKELVRLTIRLAGSVRPKDVELHFGLNHRTAVSMLKGLASKGWLRPVPGSGGDRIVRYELVRSVLDYLD